MQENGPDTLATLCRTTRLFFDTASDVLWYEQRSLVPVWKTLGSVVVERQMEESEDGKGSESTDESERKAEADIGLAINGKVEEQNWRRMKIYAGKIRILRVPKTETDDGDAYPFTNADMAKLMEDGCPLPVTTKLLEFEKVGREGRQRLTAALYLAPSLERLTMPLGGVRRYAAENNLLLGRILQTCAKLKAIELRKMTLDTEETRGLCENGGGAMHVESLRCKGLRSSGLLAVSAMPCLKRLAFACRARAGLSFAKGLKDLVAEGRLNERYFPILERLDIKFRDVDDARAIMEVGELANIRGLGFMPSEYWSEGDTKKWEKLFESSGAACKKERLKGFTVSEMGELARDRLVRMEHNVLMTMRMMQPLLGFKELRMLWLNVPVVYLLDDNDLERMARAWPQLQIFSLGARFGWMEESRVTLGGVKSLIRHCPGLKNLELVIDATKEVPERAGAMAVANNKITGLVLGNSKIRAQTDEVAEELGAVLPQLRWIETWSACSGGDMVRKRSGILEDERRSHEDRWRRVVAKLRYE